MSYVDDRGHETRMIGFLNLGELVIRITNSPIRVATIGSQVGTGDNLHRTELAHNSGVPVITTLTRLSAISKAFV